MPNPSKQIKISIYHGANRQEFSFRSGLGFQALCARQKTPIEFDCREADCGICIVSVLSGSEHLSQPERRERDYLKALNAKPNERLACQTRVFGDVEIRVEEFL